MAEGRIIKASAFTSDSISRLSDFQFRLWVGLITQADNVGRGDARPAILKGQLFPLINEVTPSDVEIGLKALAENGSIDLYEVCGKPIYAFPNWSKHQRLRKDTSKFPAPDDPAATRGDLRQLAATRGEVPPRREEKGRGREEEEEAEVEGKVPGPAPQEPEKNDLGRVMDFFMDRINPMPSPYCVDCLKAYTASLGADVVIHACGVAIDERKTGWSYIQGILQRYEREGLRSLDDVLRSEQDFQMAKERGNQPGAETSNVFLEMYDKEHSR